MYWYIIIRKTFSIDANRITCWANVDGVRAASHAVAQLMAYERNPCKPDQQLHAAQMHDAKDIEMSIELWSKRNRQNAEFRRFMELEKVQ